MLFLCKKTFYAFVQHFRKLFVVSGSFLKDLNQIRYFSATVKMKAKQQKTRIRVSLQTCNCFNKRKPQGFFSYYQLLLYGRFLSAS